MRAAAALRRLADIPWGVAMSDNMLVRPWTSAHGWAPSRIVPYGPLPLMPAASVLNYGASCFEGMKSFRVHSSSDNGAVSSAINLFRPDLHANRLNQSAARAALPTIAPGTFVGDVCTFVRDQAEWVPTDRASALYVRSVIFATQPALGVKRSNEALLVILGCAVPPFYSSDLRLLAETRATRAFPGGCGAFKMSSNYAPCVIPTETAAARGYDNVLWLDGERNVTESGVTNFFYVMHSERDPARYTLVTPPTNGLILPGVTRASILELARDKHLSHVFESVEERDMSVEELCARIASGSVVDVFGTGTAAVVCPIRSISIDGRDGQSTKEYSVQRKALELLGGDSVSAYFRARILDICHSDHGWMTPVEGDFDGKASNIDKDSSSHASDFDEKRVHHF
jgi:branched-chain amino acid aminotransferase